jgi:hypothetical protein
VVARNTEDKIKVWFLFFFGLFGIGYQQYTHDVNWILLLIFTSMTGSPMVATILSLLKNSPTVISSSSSPPEDAESDSGKHSKKS